MGTYRAPDYDSDSEPEMGPSNQSQNRRHPYEGIIKPTCFETHNMHGDMASTTERNQIDEPDEELEPEHQGQGYHYFILGRAYDQELNLLYDTRKNNEKTETSENLASQTDDETSSETESLSLGNNGLARTRDSITLYSGTQRTSDNVQESTVYSNRSENGTATDTPVSKPSLQTEAPN